MPKTTSPDNKPSNRHVDSPTLHTSQIITTLFLKLMSQSDLTYLELTDQNQHEWAEDLAASDPYNFANTASLALYHSTRTIINFKKAYQHLLELKVSPEMLRSLTKIVKAEEFGLFDEMTDEIAEKKAKKILKEARAARTKGINDRKRAIKNRARAIADDLWKKEPILRTREMAEKVKGVLVDESYKNIPDNIKTVSNWIRGVAPPEAKKPGRPRKE